MQKLTIVFVHGNINIQKRLNSKKAKVSLSRTLSQPMAFEVETVIEYLKLLKWNGKNADYAIPLLCYWDVHYQFFPC